LFFHRKPRTSIHLHYYTYQMIYSKPATCACVCLVFRRIWREQKTLVTYTDFSCSISICNYLIYIFILYLFWFVFAQRTYQVLIIYSYYIPIYHLYTSILHALMDFLRMMMMMMMMIIIIKINRTIVHDEVLMNSI